MNSQQQAKETKRYTVTIDLYVHAEDDIDAQSEAMLLVAEMRAKFDNDADILSIHETPFGSMNSRLVYGNEKTI